MKWLQNISLVLLSSLLTLIAMDLFAFYGMDLKYPAYQGERFYQYNRLTGHIAHPGAEGYWYTYRGESGRHIRINSHGFTDDEYPFAKEKPRIALLGDSVIQAWEMDEQDRPHRKVQAKLKDRFEVMNMGIRGYGIDQTLIYFQHVGIRFSPDIVVYSFCINDIKDGANTNQKPFFQLDETQAPGVRLENYPVPPPSSSSVKTDFFFQEWGSEISLFLYNRSISYRKLNDFLIGNLYNRIKRKLFDSTPPPPVPLEKLGDLRPYKKIYNPEDQRRMDLFLRLLEIMNTQMQEKGIQFLPVEGLDKQALHDYWRYTYRQRYGDVFDFDKVHKTLSEFAANRQIPFLSLSQQLESKQHVETMMYRTDAVHLNSAGSEFVSTEIVEKLVSLGWVDEIASEKVVRE